MESPLDALTVSELLRSHVEIMRELRRRGVIRTTNNPVGDYGEWLVATNLNLTLLSNSNAGYDAIDQAGTRYQIKSRRMTPENVSTQLGAIRGLDKQDFHYLIAVIFEDDFSLRRAVKIPHVVIGEYARFTPHTNSHRLLLQGPLVTDPTVQDITHLLVITEPD